RLPDGRGAAAPGSGGIRLGREDRDLALVDAALAERQVAHEAGQPAADDRDPRHHFTEPASSPWTKYRWKAKNTASGITSEMNDAGAIRSMLVPNSRSCPAIHTVIGVVFCPKVRATSRSFHVQRNWKIASDAIAGRPSGRISRTKMTISFAPSIRADSRMSFGKPMKKFLNRKIANGNPKATWKSAIPYHV